MPTFTGTLCDIDLYTAGDSRFDNMFSAPAGVTPYPIMEDELPSDRTSQFPHTTSPLNSYLGTYCGFFDNYWYNTIHIIPNPVQMGIIVSGSTVTFEVWNGYEINATLDNVDVPAALQGLTLTEPFAAPTAFAPLESRVYTLTADESGPASNDGDATFTFDGVDYVVNITATRAFVVSFPPDWTVPVKDTWEWYTEILQAYDGTEQRIKLRHKPRRTLTYSTLLLNRVSRGFDGTMFAAHKLPLAIPLWFDRTVMTSDVSVGQTVLTIDTTSHDFYDGGYLMFWSGWDNHEVLQIDSVTDTSITFRNPVQSAWLAGTEVYPIRMCRAQQNLRVVKVTATVSRAVIIARAEEHEHDWDAVETPTTYKGVSVLEVEPNRREDMEENWSSLNSRLDYGTGRELYISRSNYPEMDRSFEWMLNGRNKIKEHHEWLMAREGRYTPTWVPSWSNDMTLALNLGAGQTTMDVIDDNYRVYYQQDKGRRDLAILKKDNTFEFFRVTASAPNPPYEQLTLEAGPAAQITPADVRMISFMGLHRLSTDIIEYAYSSPTVAEVRVNMRLLNE